MVDKVKEIISEVLDLSKNHYYQALKNKLYNKMGFKQDGFFREDYWYSGQWLNSRILSRLAVEK